MPQGEKHRPDFLGDEFSRALGVAAELHATQVRKTTGVPYVSHLLGTCAIALQHGANRDQAIAALLHDALEDVRPTERAEAAVASFGDEVLRIVRGCTDGIPDENGVKPPRAVRKARYIESLRHEDKAVLLVSAADKLYNARSIVDDMHLDGLAVFDRFNATRDETIGYYDDLVDAFQSNPAHDDPQLKALVSALERAVREMHRLVDERTASAG
jgi:(p)ppGpp synthase/HD superfamily hydrolase